MSCGCDKPTPSSAVTTGSYSRTTTTASRDYALYPIASGISSNGVNLYMFKLGSNSICTQTQSRRATVGSEYIPPFLKYNIASDGTFSIEGFFDIYQPGICYFPVIHGTPFITSRIPFFTSTFGRMTWLNTGNATPSQPVNYLFTRYITKL